MTLQTMLNEAAESRPGLQLTCFKEAGLPIYVLNVRVLVKEVRALPPVETAVLRAVRAGLTQPHEIYRFLGMPERALMPVLAELGKKEYLQYSRPIGSADAMIKLTSPGRSAVAEACSVLPVERTVQICWDALTRKVVNISSEQLTKPRDMTEQGRFEVPGASARELRPTDISLEFFDAILERNKPALALKQELIAIQSIDRRELRYLECLMLFYRRTAEPSVIDVGFWREDGASLPHEQAFREIGGPERVGARLLAESASNLPESVVQTVRDTQVVAGVTGQTAAPAELEDPAGSTLQSLLCHQHPQVLRDALKNAKSRLLIISPWIRHQVVDRFFIGDLEAALRRRVKVHIGYGIDEGDRQGQPAAPAAVGVKPAITEQAKRALDALAKRYPNFKFVYIGNTHRKMLVCDTDFSVTTSFNWLSFRGSPRDKPRDEYGQLVRKQHYIDQHYNEGIKLIEQGYQGV